MLNVRLLGQFSVHYKGVPIQISSRPAQTTLAWLALTAGVEHRRDKMSAQLWPDAKSGNKLSNLRHVLWRIRKNVKDAGGKSNEYFIFNEIGVSFNSRSAYWLDAKELEQTSKRAAPTTSELIQAANLYQGELLPGFELPYSDDTDDWLTSYRAHLRNCFDDVMTKLAARLRDEQCWQDLIQFSLHWISHGDHVEAAHREMMVGYYALGDMAGVSATYDKCRSVLHKTFAIEPSDETERLFEQLLNGTFDMGTRKHAVTRAQKHAEPPHNLPALSTPIVGRDVEVQQAIALLAQTDCPLITLMGAGGIGKTRLAVEVAMHALASADGAVTFAEGIFYARLEAATSTDSLITAVADAVRLPSLGQEHPRQQLLDFLREKHMLLVLDNFEQLLTDDTDGAALVDALLGTAAHVKVLVTSRERLHLPSEHLIELDGLDYPHDGDSESDGDLETKGAVQLFLQRARRIYPRFDFAQEKVGVARICQMTQGMPLAIELAAAWVRTLSCKEIATRVEMNLDALAVTDPGLPERHRSVRAVMNYSWQLLSQAERNTFAALSVFRGGFDLDAAEVVARSSVPLLYALVDKSLLRRTPAGRYEMHELVRQFGEEKLDAAEDEDWHDTTVHARMARYFLQFAQDHAKDYTVLEPEWANFLAALRAAHERYEWPIVTELAQTLIEPWFTRARFTDAREGLALATTAASADDDLPALANVLRWRGKACLLQDDVDEAANLLNEAESQFVYLNDTHGLASVHFELSRIATYRNEFEEALDQLKKIGADIGMQDMQGAYLLGKANYQQAFIFNELGDIDRAISTAEIALQLFDRDECDFKAQAYVLLIHLYSHKEAFEKALHYGDAAFQLNNRLNDMLIASRIHHALCVAYLNSGARGELTDEARLRLCQARYHGEHAYALLKQVGERQGQAHSLYRQSMIARRLGELDFAVVLMERSSKLYREIRDVHNLVDALLLLGDFFVDLGDPQRAKTVWVEGANLASHNQGTLLNEFNLRLGIH